MSYINMNHAGWMQMCIDSAKTMKRKLHPSTPEILNEFQRKVTNILGIVGGGIYNAPINPDNIDWTYGVHGVSVVWGKDFATWDFDSLTWLVMLCHAARIRVAIIPASSHYIRLTFFPRSHEGGISEKHPNVEEMVEQFNRLVSPEHFIRYGNTESEEAKAGRG